MSETDRYEEETMLVGSPVSPDLIHLLVRSLDAVQLQDLTWKLMQGDFMLCDEDNILPVVCKLLRMLFLSSSC